LWKSPLLGGRETKETGEAETTRSPSHGTNVRKTDSRHNRENIYTEPQKYTNILMTVSVRKEMSKREVCVSEGQTQCYREVLSRDGSQMLNARESDKGRGRAGPRTESEIECVREKSRGAYITASHRERDVG
jgi:hypothetical protein